MQGEVIVAAPVTGTIVALLLTIVAAAAIVTAVTATFTKRVTVRGLISPDAGIIRIVAPRDGFLGSVLVHELDGVRAGDTLAVIVAAPRTPDLDVAESVADALVLEQAAAQTSLSSRLAVLDLEERGARRRLTALIAERAAVREQISLHQDRLTIAERDLARSEEVAARGFMAARDLDNRRNGVLEVRTQGAELRRSQLSLSRDIDALGAEIANFPATVATLRAASAASDAQMTERTLENAIRSESAVITPVAGRVAALVAHPGQAVRGGDQIAAVVPEGSRLEAELFIPSRAAGFVRIGQTVRLRLDAFPYQRFGASDGVVSSVSRSVLLPEQGAALGVTLQEPAFRVRVRLLREHVAAYGEAMPLQAGMELTADIIVEERNLAGWIMDPIYAVARR